MRRRLVIIALITLAVLLIAEALLYGLPQLIDGRFLYLGIPKLGGDLRFQDFVFLADYAQCEVDISNIYGNMDCSYTLYNLPSWIVWLLRTLGIGRTDASKLGSILSAIFIMFYSFYCYRLDVSASRILGKKGTITGLGIVLVCSYPFRLALERANLDLLIFILVGIAAIITASAMTLYLNADSVRNRLQTRERLLRLSGSLCLAAFLVDIAGLFKIYPFVLSILILLLTLKVLQIIYLDSVSRKYSRMMVFKSSLNPFILCCFQAIALYYFVLLVKPDLPMMRKFMPLGLKGDELFTGLISDIHGMFTSSVIETLAIKMLIIISTALIFMHVTRRAFRTRTDNRNADSAVNSADWFMAASSVFFGSIYSFNYFFSTPIVYRFIMAVPPLLAAVYFIYSPRSSTTSDRFIAHLLVTMLMLALFSSYYCGYRPYVPEYTFLVQSYIYTVFHPILAGVVVYSMAFSLKEFDIAFKRLRERFA